MKQLNLRSKIYDYLLEVGAEPDLEGFYRKTLQIGVIIPFDNSVTISSLKGPGVSYVREFTGVSTREIQPYNEYYRSVTPFRS
jgi:hypothetical protein